MSVTDWAGHAVVIPHSFMGTIMSYQSLRWALLQESPAGLLERSGRWVGIARSSLKELLSFLPPPPSPKGGGQKGQSAGVGVTLKGLHRDGSEGLH